MGKIILLMPAHSLVSHTKIPVLLLTGFLGAGKTTFLNYLLKEKHGEKIAVIVNEFGAIGIDQRLIVGQKEHLVEMSNGCICCSVRSDLVQTLLTLFRDSREKKEDLHFERVIIETTGLADPVPLAQTFLSESAITQHYQLESIITMVDAKHIEKQRKYLPLVEEQIACADIVILNKTDLIIQSDLAERRRLISTINPVAKLIEAREGRVPLLDLWGKQFFDVPGFLSRKTSIAACHGDHHHLSRIITVFIEDDRPVERHQFDTWLKHMLEHMGPDILRYKGFVQIQGIPNRVLLQGVHREYRLTEEGPWEEALPQQTQLVFIGTDLDVAWFQQSWQASFS